MPGMWFAGPRTSAPGPEQVTRQVASSVSAYTGDLMVLTTVTSSSARLRQLSAADKTALYENGSGDIVGILGLAASNIGSDSSGVINQVLTPVSVNSAVTPIYPLTGIDGAQAPDPVSGRSKASILLFGKENNIGGYLWENTTALESSLEGQQVGILISTINSIKYYFWSTAASVKVGRITKVNQDRLFNKTVSANVQDTTHNPRCPIVVNIYPAYCQHDSGFNYST